MSKDILFDEQANESIIAGINKVADAVKMTYGPKGHNVAFSQEYDVPLVSNDGYEIANHIILGDKFENLGASLLKEAASKSNEESGDGTTASVILAQSVINEANKSIAAGANPIFLKRGLDKAVGVVTEKLDSVATKISDTASINNIATISGNNDKEIGNLIEDIYKELGFSPVVTLMDTQMADTRLTISHGSRLDSGYLSRFFITDKNKNICEIKDPYIFLCKDEISEIQEIYHLLEEAVTNKVPLLIIARDIKGEALSALAANVEKGVVSALAIKAPGYSDTRDRNIECLAAITGATAVDSAYMDIKECGLSVCGRAASVVSDKNVTTIMQPACPECEEALSLKRKIEEQLKTETHVYQVDKLQQSLGLLNSACAVVEVGGTSELEMFERKYRIEDALNAAKRAAETGIVPGGGKALLLCRDDVKALCETLEGDEAIGAKIILKCLEAPIRQLSENSGVDASVVVDTINKNKSANFGFNALTGEYGDLIKMKIIDPVVVIKNSFVNAVSVAGTYITTSAVVA
ncbi:MAG: chaperonin GroEL [Clostridia bacterium]|nr:chaperonin GroEL [Clostridia bacterium]